MHLIRFFYLFDKSYFQELLEIYCIYFNYLVRVFSCLTDTTHVFSRFQRKMCFVPWACGNAMKIGMCSVPPPGLTSSVLSLINTSNMSSLFKDVAQKFNKLYQRKAHVHHYLQVPGFSEEDFASSLETLHEVEEGYTKLTKIKGETVPRLQVL